MKTYKLNTTQDFDYKDQNHAAWQCAKEELLLPNTAGKDIVPRTTFALLRSPTHLYFKITAEDTDPKSTLTGYNDPLYNEEAVEIFISPDGSHTRYFEFETNHLGAVFAAWINRDEQDNRTIDFVKQNPAELSVTTSKSGWVTTGKLCLASVTAGRQRDESQALVAAPIVYLTRTDRQRCDCKSSSNASAGSAGATFNVYRIKRTGTGEMMLSAFSPTGIDNFHVPSKFVKFI